MPGDPPSWNFIKSLLTRQWQNEKQMKAAIGGLTKAFWWEIVIGNIAYDSFDTYEEAETVLKRRYQRQYPSAKIRMRKESDENKEICERWIKNGGETPYWRFLPSGGESNPPVLPKGFKIDTNSNSDYWCIKRDR